jgi:hypothetical protein
MKEYRQSSTPDRGVELTVVESTSGKGILQEENQETGTESVAMLSYAGESYFTEPLYPLWLLVLHLYWANFVILIDTGGAGA